MTDDDLTTFFSTMSSARAKNILRELWGRGALCRRREKQKKVREYEPLKEPTLEFYHNMFRMNELLDEIKTGKDREIVEKELKKIIRWLFLDYLRRQKRRKKMKRKPGPRRYLYFISKKGIKQCNNLIGKGYRVWKDKPMTKWDKNHINWFYSQVHA